MAEIDMMNNEMDALKQRIKELENENTELKEHLKKYTAPEYKKKYYEDNKESIKQKHKEYKPTDEQKKKWARTAYLKKKEKQENV